MHPYIYSLLCFSQVLPSLEVLFTLVIIFSVWGCCTFNALLQCRCSDQETAFIPFQKPPSYLFWYFCFTLPKTEGVSSASKEQTEDRISYKAHSCSVLWVFFLNLHYTVIKINNASKVRAKAAVKRWYSQCSQELQQRTAHRTHTHINRAVDYSIRHCSMFSSWFQTLQCRPEETE